MRALLSALGGKEHQRVTLEVFDPELKEKNNVILIHQEELISILLKPTSMLLHKVITLKVIII